MFKPTIKTVNTDKVKPSIISQKSHGHSVVIH